MLLSTADRKRIEEAERKRKAKLLAEKKKREKAAADKARAAAKQLEKAASGYETPAQKAERVKKESLAAETSKRPVNRAPTFQGILKQEHLGGPVGRPDNPYLPPEDKGYTPISEDDPIIGPGSPQLQSSTTSAKNQAKEYEDAQKYREDIEKGVAQSNVKTRADERNKQFPKKKTKAERLAEERAAKKAKADAAKKAASDAAGYQSSQDYQDDIRSDARKSGRSLQDERRSAGYRQNRDLPKTRESRERAGILKEQQALQQRHADSQKARKEAEAAYAQQQAQQQKDSAGYSASQGYMGDIQSDAAQATLANQDRLRNESMKPKGPQRKTRRQKEIEAAEAAKIAEGYAGHADFMEGMQGDRAEADYRAVVDPINQAHADEEALKYTGNEKKVADSYKGHAQAGRFKNVPKGLGVLKVGEDGIVPTQVPQFGKAGALAGNDLPYLEKAKQAADAKQTTVEMTPEAADAKALARLRNKEGKLTKEEIKEMNRLEGKLDRSFGEAVDNGRTTRTQGLKRYRPIAKDKFDKAHAANAEFVKQANPSTWETIKNKVDNAGHLNSNLLTQYAGEVGQMSQKEKEFLNSKFEEKLNRHDPEAPSTPRNPEGSYDSYYDVPQRVQDKLDAVDNMPNDAFQHSPGFNMSSKHRDIEKKKLKDEILRSYHASAELAPGLAESGAITKEESGDRPLGSLEQAEDAYNSRLGVLSRKSYTTDPVTGEKVQVTSNTTDKNGNPVSKTQNVTNENEESAENSVKEVTEENADKPGTKQAVESSTNGNAVDPKTGEVDPANASSPEVAVIAETVAGGSDATKVETTSKINPESAADAGLDRLGEQRPLFEGDWEADNHWPKTALTFFMNLLGGKGLAHAFTEADTYYTGKVDADERMEYSDEMLDTYTRSSVAEWVKSGDEEELVKLATLENDRLTNRTAMLNHEGKVLDNDQKAHENSPEQRALDDELMRANINSAKASASSAWARAQATRDEGTKAAAPKPLTAQQKKDQIAAATLLTGDFDNVIKVPGGFETMLNSWVPNSGSFAAAYSLFDWGASRSDRRAATEGLLRLVTGAVVGKDEHFTYDQFYLPQPGETEEQQKAKIEALHMMRAQAREIASGRQPMYFPMDVIDGVATGGLQPQYNKSGSLSHIQVLDPSTGGPAVNADGSYQIITREEMKEMYHADLEAGY